MVKQTINTLNTEPCCETCVHWREGQEAQLHGPARRYRYCARLVVLTRRERTGGREVGHVMPIEAVPALDRMAEWEHSRPRAHFWCELWRNASNETFLCPERYPPDSQAYRLERDLLVCPMTDRNRTEGEGG